MTNPSPKILLDVGPSPKSLHPLADFSFCPTYYAIGHLAGLRGTVHAALIRGSLAHIGVAHFYGRIWAAQNGHDPEILYRPVEAMQMLAAKNHDEWGVAGARELATASEVVLAYIGEHSDEAEHLEILFVEQVFTFRVEYKGWVNEYTQRPDLVVRDRRTGLVWVLDHKTAFELAARTFARYAPAIQFLSYRWWTPKYFEGLYGPGTFGGVLLNMLGIDPEDKVVGKNPDGTDRVVRSFPFRRTPVEPAPFLVSRFPQIVHDKEMERARLTAERPDPWSWPAAAHEQICVSSYGKCQLWEQCLWGSKTPTPNADLVQLTFNVGVGEKG